MLHNYYIYFAYDHRHNRFWMAYYLGTDLVYVTFVRHNIKIS